MELPVIAGRECVPVRLLPYLTDWRPLSPDVIARLLAEHDAWRTWSARTYNLQGNGSYIELPPRVWDVIEDDLTILARELEGQEAFEFQQLPEWRRRSVERLPAAVFVWRDELEADYARTFGRQPYPSLRPGARETSEEEFHDELANINRLCDDPDSSVEAEDAIRAFHERVESITVWRPGDGKLSFDPLLSAGERRLVFEGFEAVLPSGLPPTNQPPEPALASNAAVASLGTPAEIAEQRQAKRYQACIDAGLKMPHDEFSRLPRGINKVAEAEGISRQSFSTDVKVHIARLNGR